MGVRGLTTYIERNRDKYLKKYNLHDTHLVIDGNSLCAQLYKFHAKCNDEFGGDYDKFARCIETFFAMLKQCQVSPIVILDGGYETKKIKTVNYRLQNKLKLIRNMNPACPDWARIFPLFHRELFKDIVLKLNIPLVRCDFEADFEIACVARRLKCPVLSYDSDFFIYDTLYIPFTTMDFYTTKINNNKGAKYCICCKIYNIEVFLKKCNIDKSLLPLMATLLGNDYIKKNVFTKFYNHIKLPKKNGKRSAQHRTIIALIKWLEHESFDSAVKKILGRLKKHERHALAQEIKIVTQGYICSYSELFDYLGLEKNQEDSEENVMDINTDDIDSDVEEEKDDSNDSEPSDSEEDSLDDIDLSIDDSDVADDMIKSQWFKNNVRNGNFPTLFIDILSLKLGIYQPQIEDTHNIESFNIFIPLLQAISKILLQDKTDFFSYLGRTEQSHAKRYRFKISNYALPKISDIPTLNNESCKFYFLKILSIPKSVYETILQFPEQWQLYLLSVIYWIKNAVNPKITYSHLSSLVLCLIQLSVVDKKVPNMRDKNYFMKKYDKQLKNILESRKNNKQKQINTTEGIESISGDIKSAIENVTFEDCLCYIETLVPNFKVNQKVKSNKNLFSVYIVDAFSQLQSCLLHIKYLNALLKLPVPSFDIWLLFNGTYIYNLYTNLEKRNDIDAYIEVILKNSPTLLNIYKQIINILNSCVELNPETRINKRRKRKRKKTVTEKDEETNENEKSESDNEVLIDHNNKFSILAITD